MMMNEETAHSIFNKLHELGQVSPGAVAPLFAEICDEARDADSYQQRRANIAMVAMKRMNAAMSVLVHAIENDEAEMGLRAMSDLSDMTNVGAIDNALLTVMFLFGGQRVLGVMKSGTTQTDESAEWDTRYNAALRDNGAMTEEDGAAMWGDLNG